ncbi:MAG: SDR family oxidoreductase [Bacteriovoracaceae bacterium]|jgi:UDP-glucuronate decarboxylase|nr:SDR family oxidoreductase [Bacteriovoracaceae bacterium]
MKKVLVTGGAGFIGSHLCVKLLERGDYVICLDNFFTGRKKNIKNILNHKNFELIEHDVIEPFYYQGLDEIYNLACPASPPHYQFNPIKTTKTSVMGAINMLGLAKKEGAKILQASTSEVYGDPKVHPQAEEYFGNVNTMGPRSCYDEGKRCAETLFYDYYKEHKVPIKIMRIFNTYGPNMLPDDGRVVSNFLIQALRGNDLTIYGNGNQTRSFCFISDLIEGMIKFMESSHDQIGPINFGNPYEISIKKLAELVIRETKSTSKIIYKDLPQDDPLQRMPDITLAKKLFNWSPKISLEQGLSLTSKWFQQTYG